MHNDASEGYFLLFDTLSDEVILEQMRIVDVRANVARLGLLPLETFLALARAR